MNKKDWITLAGVCVGLFIIIVGGGLYVAFNGEKSPGKTALQSVPPSEKTSPSQTPPPPATQPPEKPMPLQKNSTATLHTTLGDITIELNSAQTPRTVDNFVKLAKKNFYDKTIFHRVINGFMIQGGDPKGNGTGGPGYKFDDEPFEGEYTRGTVAMANSGPNTNGSQFFIMHKDYALPKNYVIFGHVIKGIEVVDKIATAPVKTSSSGESSQPLKPVVVKTVNITTPAAEVK